MTESVSTLKELAKMYHGKEAQAIADDDLWHINGVFMKSITTRKDFFIRAIQTAPNDMVTMEFFRMLYGIMELAYREKGIYIADATTLEEFCKTDLGMPKEDIDPVIGSYSMSTGYGFEITEEAFIDGMDKLSRKKKELLFKDKIGRAVAQYKEGKITEADDMVNSYVAEAKSLMDRNRPVKMSVLSETAIDRYHHTKGKIIKTGINQFDHITGGGRKGLTWIIGGYTGDGKTTITMNMAYNAMMAGHSVLWVTLELPTSDMQTMFEARHAQAIGYGKSVTFDKIDQRLFTDTEFADYKMVVSDLKKYDNLTIYEPEKTFTVDDLVAEIDRIKAYRDLDMVVVDYLELIDPTKDMKYDQYRIRVKRTMRDARLIARRKDIWMVIPHQISRGGRALAEERGQKEDAPYYMLSDLQESSGVEQNCAVMAWIFQDEFLRGNATARMGIGKNTKGRIEQRGWDVSMDFNHREIITGFVPRKR